MPKKIIDANVILRFFFEDDEEKFQRSKEFFRKLEFGEDDALLTEIVFAEVVWVLQKVYSIPRKEISPIFLKLLNYHGLKTVFSKEIFSESLKLYAIHAGDIQDIFLAVLARVKGSKIISFDKADFKKLKADFSEP
ncbi:PIN domain-containing protein [Candidatus Jettenia sp. AMX1]|uniref:PIN domain-containing protein n=1 Tax=Candidatus Jettenia sp. AMX1 TaxID=2293637 RepID=UPI0025548E5A|nr:PIN domain-containing protein [Candidatus Jettenia sp. AMX1]